MTPPQIKAAEMNVKILIFGITACIVVAGLGAYFLMKLGGEEETPSTIFFEDFESGTQNWGLEEGWHLERINNNTVLRGEDHRWARLKDMSWGNYDFRAKFKITQGTIHFNYRWSIGQDGLHRYFIGVGRDSLYLNKQISSKFYDLVHISMNLENEWHEIQIRGYENIINIYLDDKIYVAYEDEAPIMAGGVAFETLEESVFLIDDVEIRQSGMEDIVTEPTPEQIYGTWFVPDVTHSGDLVISGDETMIIEDTKYFQRGNIYISNEAKLIIRNSQFMLGRGDVPTIHTYFFVRGSLEIENSTIFPPPSGEDSGLVVVINQGKVDITDSPTSIHYFDMSEGAQLTMTNSEMIFEIGGLLQVTGGDTTLINSTIGALALRVPANAHLDISGLKSGVYFESWDVHDMIPDADYNIVLENTRILKDDFTGELEHGPYERGWLFFLDPNAHVRISDSELRKVFISLHNENIRFENLRVGIPSSLKYRDIELNDITVMGQWPFDLTDSDITISNSDYLFLQPTGQSTLSLVNSHMCEFIPRDFFGMVIFENSLWTTAGEIIGGTPYHSMGNNFTIKGSLKIGPELRRNLKWKDAQVTREYDVIIRDENGNPIEGVLIKIDGKTFVSDNAGKAKFILIFNESNYIEPKKLEALEGEEIIAQKEIDFFAETPVLIIK